MSLTHLTQERKHIMASQAVKFTTPVGRIVMGSLYKPNTTDAEGKPLVVKSGPNAGQPRTNYFFALAIPKGQERAWHETAWGQLIVGVGYAAFPQAAQSPSFAWKIEDGDSAIPNKNGRKPCENEGWKGNWILKFSGGFAPKVYRQDGGAFVQVMEPDFVKPGYFAQVAATVDGNGSTSQPGVYLNHQMVCFSAYGPEIFFGVRPEEAGFGAAPLPAGASMTPPATVIPMPAAASVPSAMPAAIPTPIASTSAPIPVTPNPAFLQVPGAPVAPAVPSQSSPTPPPAAPAAPVVPTPPSTAAAIPASPSSGPRMTEKAGAASYQAFVAAGWNDATLIANGYMLP